MNNVTSNQTFYDILGVDATADAKTIRQSYLKLAVKYHPDKNPPDKVQSAKAKFVEIGQAYEVLSDPAQRMKYDRAIRNGTYKEFSSTHNNYNSSYSNNTSGETKFEDVEEMFYAYRDIFDSHVASMSKEEVETVVGLASVVGSIIGSVLVQNAFRSNPNNINLSRGGTVSSTSTTMPLLASFGALAGSFLASQATAEVVRSIHQQSVDRVTNRGQQGNNTSGTQSSYDNATNSRSSSTFFGQEGTNTRNTTGNPYNSNNNQSNWNSDNFRSSYRSDSSNPNTNNNNNPWNDGNHSTNASQVDLDDIFSAIGAGISAFQSLNQQRNR